MTMTTQTKAAKTGTKAGKAPSGFTPEERAAMRARAKEVKAQATRAENEAALLASIAAMPDPDRSLARRLHAIVTASAPALEPKTWYGMPAYAMDGKVVCYFKSADKFKTRYATFGFEEAANLDAGAMWPTCFAVTELTADVEAKIRALVAKAAS
jgi:uncharacterized protein YdhG (YjbR/CyaY superfamily)